MALPGAKGFKVDQWTLACAYWTISIGTDLSNSRCNMSEGRHFEKPPFGKIPIQVYYGYPFQFQLIDKN